MYLNEIATEHTYRHKIHPFSKNTSLRKLLDLFCFLFEQLNSNNYNTPVLDKTFRLPFLKASDNAVEKRKRNTKNKDFSFSFRFCHTHAETTKSRPLDRKLLMNHILAFTLTPSTRERVSHRMPLAPHCIQQPQLQ
eukprot:gene5055-3642_t